MGARCDQRTTARRNLSLLVKMELFKIAGGQVYAKHAELTTDSPSGQICYSESDSPNIRFSLSLNKNPLQQINYLSVANPTQVVAKTSETEAHSKLDGILILDCTLKCFSFKITFRGMGANLFQLLTLAAYYINS